MPTEKKATYSLHQIPDSDLNRAIKIAARVVVLYGDVYLPIFNRLHIELMKLKEKKEAENLAFQLVKAYADINENE
ncbi:MAG: hypothetical protein INR73_17355 [Williamsia sp.]|nr:hypothetical protein [Williamsia sp.]